jgi:hypothetical protein
VDRDEPRPGRRLAGTGPELSAAPELARKEGQFPERYAAARTHRQQLPDQLTDRGEAIAALDGDVVGALLDDPSRGLAPHTDDAGLSFPFGFLVITAGR